MLWKSEGFFLLELLLSLSVLLMLSLFFVPLFVDFAKQEKQLEIDQQAEQFIYEELKASLINENISPDHSIFLNGIDYTIIWKNHEVTGYQEVCVKVEKTKFSLETNICRSAE